MKNQTAENRILEAMTKQEPKEPRVYELGGDYYYKCYWVSCNTDINSYMNYCPECGQKIQWEGIK